MSYEFWSILGVIIKYLMNVAYLGWVDRIGGSGTGMIKAVLICAVLLVALAAFLPKGAPVIKKSVLAPYVMLIAENMGKVVSHEMKTEFVAKVEELKKAWQMRTP